MNEHRTSRDGRLTTIAGVALAFGGFYVAVLKPLSFMPQSARDAMETTCRTTPGCEGVKVGTPFDWTWEPRWIVTFHLAATASGPAERVIREATRPLMANGHVRIEFERAGRAPAALSNRNRQSGA